jgi:hypothetical protein
VRTRQRFVLAHVEAVYREYATRRVAEPKPKLRAERASQKAASDQGAARKVLH